MDAAGALAGHMARHVVRDGVHATAIPRLSLIRSDRPTEPLHALHAPAFCLVAQGRKRVMLGREVFHYGPEHCLTVSVDLPVVGEVVEADPDRPYLCVRLDLDPAMLGALLREAGLDGRHEGDGGSGLFLNRSTPELVDAATRLVRLLDAPCEAAVLAPLAERELLYRVLLSGQAARLRQVAFADSSLRRVGRAIDWIKQTFREPFSAAAVAGAAGMSQSSLHQHFKAVTALSPLQYQKRLRLQEARRLVLGGMDAASAGHGVGYDSASQFSRDYRRLFGAPPMRDAAKFRSCPGEPGQPVWSNPEQPYGPVRPASSWEGGDAMAWRPILGRG